MNSIPQVPLPRNEPVLGYAPGSPECAELKAALSVMSSEEIEIPLVIGGREVRTGDTDVQVMPHDHGHVLGVSKWRRVCGHPERLRGVVGICGGMPSDWDEVESELERLKGEGISQRLEQVPASRLALFVALPAISSLPTRDMLRHLARNDPSGYWTACVLGTVAYLQSRPAAERRDLALRNGVARLLPGMAGKGAPNALASASSQFLASRGLKVKPEGR